MNSKTPENAAAVEPIVMLDHPLSADIEDMQLVIRIGVDRLVFCSETDDGSPFKGKKVRDANELCKDIIREMNREDEQGYSPLMKFLDDMEQAAIDDGSIAFET